MCQYLLSYSIHFSNLTPLVAVLDTPQPCVVIYKYCILSITCFVSKRPNTFEGVHRNEGRGYEPTCSVLNWLRQHFITDSGWTAGLGSALLALRQICVNSISISLLLECIAVYADRCACWHSKAVISARQEIKPSWGRRYTGKLLQEVAGHQLALKNVRTNLQLTQHWPQDDSLLTAECQWRLLAGSCGSGTSIFRVTWVVCCHMVVVATSLASCLNN